MISVLYVDDDDSLLEIGKIYLERTKDFTVTLQNSAKKALKTLKERSFDAIVSDYQMPLMDGLEFLELVRQEYGELPFILFTGKGREEVVILALNRGVDFYLQKGGEPKSQFAELAHKIKQSVQRKRAELALEESERRYREIVEIQTEFIARFRPDLTYIFVNDAYCRYFGKKREEIIGSRYIPKFPPEDKELIRNHFAALTIDKPDAELEHRVIMPDGTIRWHWWSDRAIFDDKGILTGYQSVGRDITDRKAAQDALLESEAKFRALADVIPIGITVIQGNKDVFVNNYTSSITGYTKEELCKMDFWDAIHPDYQAILKDRGLARQRGEEVPNRYEVQYITRSGELRWVEVYAESIIFEGRPAAISMLIDITERKNSENELKAANEQLISAKNELLVKINELKEKNSVIEESKKDYQSIIENLQDAFYRTDVDGNLTMFSPSFVKEFGYDNIQEVLGKNVRNTFYLNPEDRDGFLKIIEPLGEIKKYELILKRKDGEPVFVSASCHIYYDREGRVAGVEGILHNITDIKKAEEVITESERKYRELADLLPQMVFEMDTNFNVTYTNQYTLKALGFDENDIKDGINALSFIDPGDHSRIFKNLSSGLDYNSIEEHKYTAFLKYGRIIPVLIYASPITKDNNIVGYRGVIVDISHEKKLEEKLENCEARLKLINGET